MIKRERMGEVYYMHKPSKTIVSKVCKVCENIKLVEDFNELEAGEKGMAGTKSLCKKCEEGKGENE